MQLLEPVFNITGGRNFAMWYGRGPCSSRCLQLMTVTLRRDATDFQPMSPAAVRGVEPVGRRREPSDGSRCMAAAASLRTLCPPRATNDRGTCKLQMAPPEMQHSIKVGRALSLSIVYTI